MHIYVDVGCIVGLVRLQQVSPELEIDQQCVAGKPIGRHKITPDEVGWSSFSDFVELFVR